MGLETGGNNQKVGKKISPMEQSLAKTLSEREEGICWKKPIDDGLGDNTLVSGVGGENKGNNNSGEENLATTQIENILHEKDGIGFTRKPILD